MLVLKRYLMVFLILNCGHAVADLPDNASAYDTISTWLKSTEHSISIKDIVTP